MIQGVCRGGPDGALGCALGQGFYYAGPMPEAEARAYLERRLHAAA